MLQTVKKCAYKLETGEILNYVPEEEKTGIDWKPREQVW
jgi:hypothetical protein